MFIHRHHPHEEGPIESDPQPKCPVDRATELEDALGGVEDFATSPFVSAAQLINPLLAVWDAARDLSPRVSAPVEALLTLSVKRTLIHRDEILSCIAEVRALAAEESLLWQLTTS